MGNWGYDPTCDVRIDVGKIQSRVVLKKKGLSALAGAHPCFRANSARIKDLAGFEGQGTWYALKLQPERCSQPADGRRNPPLHRLPPANHVWIWPVDLPVGSSWVLIHSFKWQMDGLGTVFL